LIRIRINVEKKKFNAIVEKTTTDISIVQDVFTKGKIQTG